MAADRAVFWVYLLAVAVLAIDVATKAAVVVWIPLYGSFEITSWFNIGHWLNPGAAFSFLAQAGGWQRGFFIAVGLAASAFLTWFIAREKAATLEAVGYAGILGGALGNVFDRTWRGAVVDWLDFHWGDWHWPAFNAADIGITLGVATLLIAAFRSRGRNSTESHSPAR